jgi:hypothetical protein
MEDFVDRFDLLVDLFGEGVAPEEAAGLLYLINGVLCLFVAEARDVRNARAFLAEIG